MALLAQYRTVPTIEATIHTIIHTLEHPTEHIIDMPNWVNGLVNEIFHHYFPPEAGWMVLPRRSADNRQSGLIMRVGRWVPDIAPAPSPRPRFEDRVVAIVTTTEAGYEFDVRPELNRLHASGVIETGDYWVAVFEGSFVSFFSCHREPWAEVVTRPLGPPMQMGRNMFHIRDDCLAVEEMIRHMAFR
ncbi:uncharacterized protein APUU_50743S [Aspergillus puulaauensis]|uniref:Uncharacterized protein n=1 Tax=Aspergillus puulaauensis TaxID=1220207 RepID=A0A7R7XQU7_9EURO|nr:uncharacterized protein APUU_50743S [Aspergillus puulaauensis]BCS26032.1 hypothetical protein APUU_50743S [Aspergillus puulaauensis]